jgi:hypothetical protein
VAFLACVAIKRADKMETLANSVNKIKGTN